MVRTRLEIDIECGARNGFGGILYRQRLGVLSPEPFMMSLTYDPSVFHNNCAYHRVRANMAIATFCELESFLDEFAVDHQAKFSIQKIVS